MPVVDTSQLFFYICLFACLSNKYLTYYIILIDSWAIFFSVYYKLKIEDEKRITDVWSTVSTDGLYKYIVC